MDTRRLILPAVVVGGTLLLAHTSADPDLWGHVRFGQDIVRTATVRANDAYSFTSDKTWVNHEWLSEAAMYGAYRIGGPAGLVGLKVAGILALLLIVDVYMRRVLRNSVDRAMLVALLLFGAVARLLPIRPQLFSVVLYAALLSVLGTALPARRRLLFVIPTIFALWANLHGGWVVGLATVWVWFAVYAAEQSLPSSQIVLLAGVASAATLATAVTPYGFRLWTFMYETVGFSREGISDWAPMYRLPLALVVPWITVVCTASAIVAQAGRRCGWPRLGVTVMLAFASFRIGRIDAFLAIAVVMLLGPFAHGTARRASCANSARPPTTQVGPVMIAAACVMPALYAAWISPLHQISVRDDSYPDARSTVFISTNKLRGRILVPFDWGEYAIWHFGPELKVSIDGRRETVYSNQALQDNEDFFAGRPEAAEYAQRTKADFAWVGARSPAAVVVERLGWRQVFKGSNCSLYARDPAASYKDVPAITRNRYFPGP